MALIINYTILKCRDEGLFFTVIYGLGVFLRRNKGFNFIELNFRFSKFIF